MHQPTGSLALWLDTVMCATRFIGIQDVLEETLLQLQAFVPKAGDMCCCLSLRQLTNISA